MSFRSASSTTKRPVIDDPLTLALLPPRHESPDARSRRMRAEEEAKRVSDAIDERLREEKAAAKKKNVVRLLLLGQSESGKSTTLKQFLLLADNRAFAAERNTWRLIVYFNLVRSIRVIVELLEAEIAPASEADLDYGELTPTSRDPDVMQHAQTVKELRMRLSPLLHVEQQLISLMSLSEEADSAPAVRTPPMSPPNSPSSTSSESEFFVRPNSNWKRNLSRRALRFSKPRSPKSSSISSQPADGGIDWDDKDDPGRVVVAFADDMKRLWEWKVLKRVLRRQRRRLEDEGGFFLDDVDRITSRRYIPTDDDILRARIKTVGVTEHEFTLNRPNERPVDWKIYDVGGARSQRAVWAPYFDDVNVIIFLAPISAFDEKLQEDRRVNRLEDSLTLWKELFSNPVLKEVPVVLFLNKCDILRAKIEAGIQVTKYVPSYGDRPNQFEAVMKYFKTKFDSVRKQSPVISERPVFTHFTSVIDTKTTASIIGHVGDMLIRENLKSSKLL
ncbi:hypothetical protein BOTBODRAFT_142043 [Botryobasidium botryosum FD-172 SS1]|uniref:G-alpha-domain-containing protein n=1 Tax=Botryobasidium botryosum (strain FD-172 SS1) TaxID=930990 RepID=A0A067N8L9_BOTB1|nr:hypothetical protein BOTBODRAFT_142043 [Botryobasidium botryosum FD-172 SS1]